jgi:hypothetical protein
MLSRALDLRRRVVGEPGPDEDDPAAGPPVSRLVDAMVVRSCDANESKPVSKSRSRCLEIEMCGQMDGEMKEAMNEAGVQRAVT